LEWWNAENPPLAGWNNGDIKLQITNNKYQTNHNDQNSKFQTF
jgi:hypothetical protein